MQRMLHAAILLGVIASAGIANASCKQTNAAGYWASYETYPGKNKDMEVTCHLKINAQGEIEKTSLCRSSLGTDAPATGHIILTSSARCAYKVSITQSNRIFTLNDVTLGLGAMVMYGAGVRGGLVVSFSMIEPK